MTVEDLLTLPLDESVRWEEFRVEGKVSSRDESSLTISWADGTSSFISNDDEDLAELASMLERVQESVEADEPIVVNG